MKYWFWRRIKILTDATYIKTYKYKSEIISKDYYNGFEDLCSVTAHIFILCNASILRFCLCILSEVNNSKIKVVTYFAYSSHFKANDTLSYE